jgi:hypothetical protein
MVPFVEQAGETRAGSNPAFGTIRNQKGNPVFSEFPFSVTGVICFVCKTNELISV